MAAWLRNTRPFIAPTRAWLFVILLLVQAAGAIAAEPIPEPAPNLALKGVGSAEAIARDSQGRTLIGGSFSEVDGLARSNLVRLNADGSVDTSFDVPVSATVLTIAVASDDSIYIGGSFFQVGGINRALVARVGSDGTVDASFPVPQPNTGSVYSLALDESNGALFYGGKFGYSDATLPNLSKVSTSTGAIDPDFGFDIAATVRALALDGLGGLYVGGSFSEVNSQARNGLARVFINGTSGTAGLDTNFIPALSPVNGLSQGVYTIAFDGTAVYSGGLFANNATSVAKLDPVTGASNPSWQPTVEGTVLSLALAPDNQLIVGGNFRRVAGLPRAQIARLSRVGEGLVDPSWTPTVGVASFGGRLNKMAIDGDTVYIGGTFQSLSGTAVTGFGALPLQGTIEPLASMDAKLAIPNGSIIANQAMPDGSLWIGGSFIAINDVPRQGIAHILRDGSVDMDVDYSVPGTVYDMGLDANGRLYVGGAFDTADGLDRYGLFRIGADRQVDPGYLAAVSHSSLPGAVIELALSDNALYVTGILDAVGSIGGASSLRHGVAKFDLQNGDPVDGWAPELSGPSATAPVYPQAVAVDTVRDWVYFGGSFSYVDGIPHKNIARASATTGDTDHSFGPTADDGDVWAIGVDEGNGDVYVGGIFLSFNGSTGQNGFLRLESVAGANDTSFQPGLAAYDQIESIFLCGDDSVCAGGYMQVNGAVARFSRTDGQRDPRFDPQVAGYVTNMSYRPTDRSLIVSGTLSNVGGVPRTGIAALRVGPTIFNDGLE